MNRIDALTDNILDSLSQSSVTGWPAGAGVETGASQERAKSVTDANSCDGVHAERAPAVCGTGARCEQRKAAAARTVGTQSDSQDSAAPLGEPGRISRLSPFQFHTCPDCKEEWLCDGRCEKPNEKVLTCWACEIEQSEPQVASLKLIGAYVSKFKRKLDELDELISRLEVKRV